MRNELEYIDEELALLTKGMRLALSLALLTCSGAHPVLNVKKQRMAKTCTATIAQLGQSYAGSL